MSKLINKNQVYYNAKPRSPKAQNPLIRVGYQLKKQGSAGSLGHAKRQPGPQNAQIMLGYSQNLLDRRTSQAQPKIKKFETGNFLSLRSNSQQSERSRNALSLRFPPSNAPTKSVGVPNKMFKKRQENGREAREDTQEHTRRTKSKSKRNVSFSPTPKVVYIDENTPCAELNKKNKLAPKTRSTKGSSTGKGTGKGLKSILKKRKIKRAKVFVKGYGEDEASPGVSNAPKVSQFGAENGTFLENGVDDGDGGLGRNLGRNGVSEDLGGARGDLGVGFGAGKSSVAVVKDALRATKKGVFDVMLTRRDLNIGDFDSNHSQAIDFTTNSETYTSKSKNQSDSFQNTQKAKTEISGLDLTPPEYNNKSLHHLDDRRNQQGGEEPIVSTGLISVPRSDFLGSSMKLGGSPSKKRKKSKRVTVILGRDSLGNPAAATKISKPALKFHSEPPYLSIEELNQKKKVNRDLERDREGLQKAEKVEKVEKNGEIGETEISAKKINLSKSRLNESGLEDVRDGGDVKEPLNLSSKKLSRPAPPSQKGTPKSRKKGLKFIKKKRRPKNDKAMTSGAAKDLQNVQKTSENSNLATQGKTQKMSAKSELRSRILSMNLKADKDTPGAPKSPKRKKKRAFGLRESTKERIMKSINVTPIDFKIDEFRDSGDGKSPIKSQSLLFKTGKFEKISDFGFKKNVSKEVKTVVSEPREDDFGLVKGPSVKATPKGATSQTPVRNDGPPLETKKIADPKQKVIESAGLRVQKLFMDRLTPQRVDFHGLSLKVLKEKNMNKERNIGSTTSIALRKGSKASELAGDTSVSHVSSTKIQNLAKPPPQPKTGPGPDSRNSSEINRLRMDRANLAKALKLTGRVVDGVGLATGRVGGSFCFGAETFKKPKKTRKSTAWSPRRPHSRPSPSQTDQIFKKAKNRVVQGNLQKPLPPRTGSLELNLKTSSKPSTSRMHPSIDQNFENRKLRLQSSKTNLRSARVSVTKPQPHSNTRKPPAMSRIFYELQNQAKQPTVQKGTKINIQAAPGTIIQQALPTALHHTQATQSRHQSPTQQPKMSLKPQKQLKARIPTYIPKKDKKTAQNLQKQSELRYKLNQQSQNAPNSMMPSLILQKTQSLTNSIRTMPSLPQSSDRQSLQPSTRGSKFVSLRESDVGFGADWRGSGSTQGSFVRNNFTRYFTTQSRYEQGLKAGCGVLGRPQRNTGASVAGKGGLSTFGAGRAFYQVGAKK